MAKYSYDFKKKIVQEYLDGNGGYKYLAKKYNIEKRIKEKLGWMGPVQYRLNILAA